MVVRKLRDLSKPEPARIVHLQRITSAAWKARKSPDDGVLLLTDAMEAKRGKIAWRKLPWWALGFALFVYAGASVIHTTLSILGFAS